jgi:phosphohistidine phosphatase
MLLYLVRHGIAVDRTEPECPSEAERHLTPEGVEKTERVAKGISKLVSSADLMVSSPYVRAVQTAEIFATVLGYAKEKIVRTEALLPGSDSAVLFRELAKQKDAGEVFCFGHAPQLDEAVAFALGAKQMLTALKKAGVACLGLERVSPPSGTLLWLCPPKILRRL